MALAIFYTCEGQSDLAGIMEERFSHEQSHLFKPQSALKSVFVHEPLAGFYEILDYYANTPVQYIAIFHGCKNDSFQMKN